MTEIDTSVPATSVDGSAPATAQPEPEIEHDEVAPEAAAEPDAELVAELAPVADAELVAELAPVADAEPELVADAELVAELAPEADAEPELVADAEPVSEPELDSAIERDRVVEAEVVETETVVAEVVVEPSTAVEGAGPTGPAPTEPAPAEPAPTEPAPAEPAPTAGRAIGDALAAAGARLAFTVPGESFLGLIEGLSAAGIHVVATRHEGAASFMAEAASQLTGRPQLVLATRAVGASNAAIGIHTARQDSAPMVALIGQVKRGHMGREAFQEVDLVRTIGGLSIWSAEATTPDDALRLIGEGLAHMSRGRPGPILISLPEDILDEPVTPGVVARAAAAGGPAADRGEVRDVLRLLAGSRRGLILAGGGVLRARATKRLVALSEALAVPVVAAWRRPDVFPNDHPHYLGMAGYWAARSVKERLLAADVLLVLGCRLSEITSYAYSVPGPATRWAHVDLEPRVASGGLAAPDIALTADAARFLDAAWSDLRSAALDAENRSAREAANAEDRVGYLAASTLPETPWDGPGVSPARVIATLQRLLPEDALITTDAGNFGGWAARGFRFRRPGTFLGPTSGAMGYAVPAAIAASILRPDRPAVALCGDGGFAMTMAELETAVRERARPIVIVFDNQAYGTIRMHQQREGRAIVGTELGAIDFAEVARACGALGLTVEDDAAFEPALAQALEARCPVVIHMHVDRRWVSVDEGP